MGGGSNVAEGEEGMAAGRGKEERDGGVTDAV
jgi:hypothetical protein